MNISLRLSHYIAKEFLKWFSMVFVGIATIIYLVEFMEMIRRAAGKPGVHTELLASMALYKLPSTLETLFPFIGLFASLFTFWRLKRYSELIIMRSLGLSSWEIGLPAVITALALGAIHMTVLNPLGAHLNSHLETLETKFFKHTSETIFLFNTGIWVRQKNEAGFTTLLRAKKLTESSQALENVTIFGYNAEGQMIHRSDSARAVFHKDGVRLFKGWHTPLKGKPRAFKTRFAPLSISLKELKKSFRNPQTLSFWELQEFALLMEKAGFSPTEHLLHWHRLLAQWFWLIPLVLIGLACSIYSPRQTSGIWITAIGILGGFFLYLIRDISHAMGIAGSMPIIVATWTPILLSYTAGMALSLHTEG